LCPNQRAAAHVQNAKAFLFGSVQCEKETKM
jgi:hypothetical protein